MGHRKIKLKVHYCAPFTVSCWITMIYSLLCQLSYQQSSDPNQQGNGLIHIGFLFQYNQFCMLTFTAMAKELSPPLSFKASDVPGYVLLNSVG